MHMHIDLHLHTYTYTGIYVELSDFRATKPLLHNTKKQIKTQYQKWLGSFGAICQWHPTDSPQKFRLLSRLIYTLELDGKTLLLKTQHTQFTVHGDIKLVLNWILHPYYITFVVLEDTLVLFMIREEKSKHQPYLGKPENYNNDKTCLLVQQWHKHNGGH